MYEGWWGYEYNLLKLFFSGTATALPNQDWSLLEVHRIQKVNAGFQTQKLSVAGHGQPSNELWRIKLEITL